MDGVDLDSIKEYNKENNTEYDIVLVSMMEHHSNDLPHRKHGGKVIHIPLEKNQQKY